MEFDLNNIVNIIIITCLVYYVRKQFNDWK